VELAGADARKLLVVLRAKDGDRVEICDSSGSSFSATLAIDGSRVRARLGDAHEPPAPRAIELVLAQALPKGQKMDFAIEKATELGIACIIPFTSERSVAGAARAGKLERWRRLAHTAAQQCGRRDVPAVEDPVEWDVLTERFRSYDLALVPWELAEPIPLRERLPALLRGARRRRRRPTGFAWKPYPADRDRWARRLQRSPLRGRRPLRNALRRRYAVIRVP